MSRLRQLKGAGVSIWLRRSEVRDGAEWSLRK